MTLLLACNGGSGGDTTGDTTAAATTMATTSTSATSTSSTGEPTTSGTSSASGESTTEPALPCDILEQLCPDGYVCEGGFEEAFCVPDLCIGVTCEGTLECYQGVCTCLFADCPDGMYCDYEVEPETCKPDPCAALDCPIFSWCYPSVGTCETCPDACGPDAVCDQANVACEPIVTTAADACVDAPLVIIPPYPDEVWFAGDLGSATVDPAFAECSTPDVVEQVVRIQLNDDGTFYFRGLTESLDVRAQLYGPGSTCDALGNCGTSGTASGSPINDEYEFNLSYFFDPGTYLLTISGPAGAGPWWIRAGQA